MEPDELELARQRAAARQRQLSFQPAPAPGTPDRTLLGTFPDNGRVFRLADGTLEAVSAGGATRDQATVQRIMEGGTFADAMQTRLDEERIAQNPVAARANEFVRGTPALGSWIDEAVGAVSPEAAQNMRATTEAMQRQRPGQTAALNIAGGVVGSVPAAMVAAPAIAANAPTTIGARALAGAGLGAATMATEGAIYGGGEGRPGTRLQEAGRGAAIGAGVGGVLGAAAPYAAEGLRALLGRLQRSDLSTISAALGVGRDAATKIRMALANGNMDEAVAAVQRGGDDAMLADAGRAMADLADEAASVGGQPNQIIRGAVRERTQEATRSIVGVLDDVLGAPQGESDLIRQIRTNSQPARSTAYDAAYSQPINYAEGPGQRLESLIPRLPRQAITRANEIMRTRGEQSAQIIAREGPDGSFTLETMPDVRQWHYIMQGLDDVIQNTDGMGAMRGQTTLGASFQSLRSQISQNLRRAVPEFGQAQSVAADAIRQQGAVETGYTLFRMRRDEVTRAVADMTPAERAAAGQGLRAYVDDTMARVTRTMSDPDNETREGIRALRDFSSRQNQTNLRLLLGQRRADRLIGEIDQAATAFELRANIAENSRTALRGSQQQATRDILEGGALRTAMRGEAVNAGKRLTQALTGETAEATELRRMGLYEDLARALTQTRGGRAVTALRMIERAMAGQQQLSQRQAEFIADVVTTGVLAGDQATQTLLSTP